MANYGFEGTWKTELGVITEAAITSGANTAVDIAQGLTFNPTAGVTYITCIITTDDPLRIEIGGVSSATSFAITSADKFICTLAHDRPIGLWGDGATPDVTIQRVIMS